MPLSNLVMVDRDRCLQLVAEIRAKLPADITAAKSVIENQKNIINEARAMAEQTRNEANSRAARSVNEASAQAQNTIANANKQAQDMLQKANAQAQSMAGCRGQSGWRRERSTLAFCRCLRPLISVRAHSASLPLSVVVR